MKLQILDDQGIKKSCGMKLHSYIKSHLHIMHLSKKNAENPKRYGEMDWLVSPNHPSSFPCSS